MRRLIAFSGAVVFLAACGQDATAPEMDLVAPQFTHVAPTSVTVFAEADATVNSFNSNSNYGSGLRLDAAPSRGACGLRGESRAFLRFDLSGIPQTAVINSATFRTVAPGGFAWGGDGTTYTSYVTDDSWSESTITWNNQPAAGDVVGSWWIWSGYPCQYAAFKGNRVAATDIAAQVQTEVAGDQVISLRLHNPGYWLSHYSREHTDPTQTPQLIIEWEHGDPPSKAACKSGDWEDYGFRNQGQCVRFIETGKDSR